MQMTATPATVTVLALHLAFLSSNSSLHATPLQWKPLITCSNSNSPDAFSQPERTPKSSSPHRRTAPEGGLANGRHTVRRLAHAS